MKKFLLLILCTMFSCIFLFSCIDKKSSLAQDTNDLGNLIIYGSAEEGYVAAIAAKFEEQTGIKTSYVRLSSGEVLTKIQEENGNPSADVWFGGTTDPYNEAANKGLLLSYNAANAKNLLGPEYKHPHGYWYGIYRGIMGFFWNTELLKNAGVEPPKDWDDLKKTEYRGMISFANPNTSGTGMLVINTNVQMRGRNAAMKYFEELDKNVVQYTKSGSSPSRMVPLGEVAIGIGFLHDAVHQIVDIGYDNIGIIAPESGTTYEIGATAIFKGAKNEENAKKFIEFALSPEAVNLAQDNGSYQFLVIDNAKPVQAAVDAGLDEIKTIDYDFEDAAMNGPRYREEFFNTIKNDERVQIQ